MFRENIIVEIEDVGLAGRFLAKAAIQQLQDQSLPLMQQLEIPTDTL
jgi:LacI family transcriptional regulator